MPVLPADGDYPPYLLQPAPRNRPGHTHPHRHDLVASDLLGLKGVPKGQPNLLRFVEWRAAAHRDVLG